MVIGSETHNVETRSSLRFTGSFAAVVCRNHTGRTGIVFRQSAIALTRFIYVKRHFRKVQFSRPLKRNRFLLRLHCLSLGTRKIFPAVKLFACTS